MESQPRGSRDGARVRRLAFEAQGLEPIGCLPHERVVAAHRPEGPEGERRDRRCWLHELRGISFGPFRVAERSERIQV